VSAFAGNVYYEEGMFWNISNYYAPTNNWSNNNITNAHGFTYLSSSHCTDLDGDTLSYWSNNTLFPILTNGSINFTNTSILNIGSYLVNITCGDQIHNTSATVQINVTNTIPLVSTITLGPLPTQAGQALNITSYNCTDADNDTCTNVSYDWYKNGVDLSVNTSNLSASYYVLGDNLTGSVRAYDGANWSAWANSSPTQIGDSIMPNITVFNETPQSFVITGQATFTIVCTDNSYVGSVLVQITDPNSVKANFSATGANSTYTLAYSPPLAGTYGAMAYCLDANSNQASTTSLNFLVSMPVQASNGGGGSSAIATGCDFQILTPVNGFINTLCKIGAQSSQFEFSFINLENTAQTYYLTAENVTCRLNETSMRLEGRSTGTAHILSCDCPTTGDALTGDILIRNGACTATLPVQFYTSWLPRLMHSGSTLGMVGVILFVAGILILSIIIYLVRNS
jgi:hypothetical protein